MRIVVKYYSVVLLDPVALRGQDTMDTDLGSVSVFDTLWFDARYGDSRYKTVDKGSRIQPASFWFKDETS